MKGKLTVWSKCRWLHQLQNHRRGKLAPPSALGRVRPLREQQELEKDQGTCCREGGQEARERPRKRSHKEPCCVLAADVGRESVV